MANAQRKRNIAQKRGREEAMRRRMRVERLAPRIYLAERQESRTPARRRGIMALRAAAASVVAALFAPFGYAKA